MPYASGRTIHDADAHIMETPTWLRDHADPDIRDRIAPLDLSSGNELRQTGDPEEQLKDLVAAFDRLAAKHASEAVPGRRGGGDHESQELRRHRLVRGRGPAPGPRPARLLEPARLQHVPQPAAARLGARRRPRAGLGAARAHNRGMVEFCAGDDRLLPTCYVPLFDIDAAPGLVGEALTPGRGGAAHRVGLPARALPQPRRPRPGVGEGPGGGHPGRLPRRRNGDLIDRTTSRTACRSRPTSTAARRTSARSTTWASPTRPCRRSPR